MRGVGAGIVFFNLAAFVGAQDLSFKQSEIPVGPGCCSVVTGDFNNDGIPDLAVAYGDSAGSLPRSGIGHILILLGNGDGTFISQPVPGEFGSYLELVSAVDVNGDQNLDLLATTSGTQSQTILLPGNGDGSFRSPAVVANDRLLLSGDFNGDGKPDLLFSGFLPGQFSAGLRVRMGNGDGRFGPPISTAAAENFTPLNFAISITSGDFNGDGKTDIAFTSPLHAQQATVYVWLANGDGTFTMQPPLADYMEFYTLTGHPVVTGDFNGDGNLDIAVKTDVTQPDNTMSPAVGVFLGNGDGTFRAAGLSPLTVGTALGTADFDGDGTLDLAADASVLPGNGDGKFQGQLFFGYGPVPGADSRLVIADLNGDGRPDLVVARGGTALAIFLNDSPGSSHSVFGVSAASGQKLLAPESIGSIIGSNLTAGTARARDPFDPPTSLGGISLHVRDALGADRLARLALISQERINFVVPPETAEGFATLNIDDGSPGFLEGARATLIRKLAPGFFTADGSGSGPPMATALRLLPDGTQMPVPIFDCSRATCTAVPIDLSDGLPVYLSLYGTGFRNTATLGNGFIDAHCGFGTSFGTTTYAGAQSQYSGLDRLDIRLPQVRALGETDLVCRFEFYGAAGFEAASARPVRINIK
jgi:uncharacterized protein (TIGR03437 family)